MGKNVEEKRCWICKKSKKEIQEYLDKVKNDSGDLYDEDLMLMDPDKYNKDCFKGIKIYICIICSSILNGWIDGKHNASHECDEVKLNIDGVYELKNGQWNRYEEKV